jgi:hypothetical protein
MAGVTTSEYVLMSWGCPTLCNVLPSNKETRDFLLLGAPSLILYQSLGLHFCDFLYFASRAKSQMY